MPTDEEITAALRYVGSKWLQLDADSRSIQFLQASVELNLGGIGKGYALDRCAELLEDAGIDSFLIHGGQSSVLARGSRAGEQTADGWWVGLQHPLRPELRLAEIRLDNRSLGTSGSAMQSFRYRGRRYGHILDPRTGWPADAVFSSTVLAPDAATADALATALYVMGVDAAVEFCRHRSDLACLLVTSGSRSGTVQVHCCRLPEDQVKLLGGDGSTVSRHFV